MSGAPTAKEEGGMMKEIKELEEAKIAIKELIKITTGLLIAGIIAKLQG